ncbi:hypothetical protein JCM5353_003853 [Sporobolomyces roseus]
MDEFHKTGLALRKRANEALQAKQPGKAVEGFTLALTGPNGPSQKEHMAALHTGRATAYIALRGYHFALLDACAALQYNDKYHRAFEKRALARKGILGFSFRREAAEDYLDAAACSNEPNYKRRMKAEARAMLDEDEAERRAKMPEFFTIERDFEGARIEYLSRGDDLSKNPTARCIIKAYNEIDEGWKQFYETCDPESENPNLDGLSVVLEAAALEPRAAHFTCRSVPTKQLLEKLDALMQRHSRPFEKGGHTYFIDLIPKIGLNGPNGVVGRVHRWLVLNLVLALQSMSEGSFEFAIESFANSFKAYHHMINAKLLSKRLSRGPRLWDLIIFCAYRLLLVGRILGMDQGMNNLVTTLIGGVRDDYEGIKEGSQDPLIVQSRKRCLARAYAVEAFFARGTARMPDNADYLIGPSPKDELCRDSVDYMLGTLPAIYLRKADAMSYRATVRPKTLDDFLDLQLRPAGTIVIHGEASVSVPDYQDRDVLGYMEKQTGDLSLWSFEAVADFDEHEGADSFSRRL